jgi:hypothetical protein
MLDPLQRATKHKIFNSHLVILVVSAQRMWLGKNKHHTRPILYHLEFLAWVNVILASSVCCSTLHGRLSAHTICFLLVATGTPGAARDHWPIPIKPAYGIAAVQYDEAEQVDDTGRQTMSLLGGGVDALAMGTGASHRAPAGVSIHFE